MASSQGLLTFGGCLLRGVASIWGGSLFYQKKIVLFVWLCGLCVSGQRLLRQLSGKLEGMFKDIELSRDIMASFRQSKESRDPRLGDVDLTVYVLTTGYWPTYQPCTQLAGKFVPEMCT